jgi:hypothetical protein
VVSTAAQNTGDSMRIRLKIDTVHYTADTLCDNLIYTSWNIEFGKTILIVAQQYDTADHQKFE